MDRSALETRMATPAKQLGLADAQAERKRLDHGYLLPAELLRIDALDLRLRELAGEAVEWPMLTDCIRCQGSGYDPFRGEWVHLGPCEACRGRGKVAIELTDSAQLRLIPTAMAVDAPVALAGMR